MENTIISKASKKGKFLDFRDNLVPASEDEYTMLHGIGGKKHAVLSTIKLMLCDYSKGTGDKSVSVQSNLTTDIIYTLYYYVKDRVTKPLIAEKTITPSGEKFLASALRGILKLKEGGKFDEKNIDLIGQLLTQMQKEIGNSGKPGEYDYQYAQDRVDVYNIDKKTGIAPVNKFQISRQSIRPDGNKSDNPWFICISNGEAKTIEQTNGTISYEGKTYKVKAQAFINLSDAELYKALQRVVRYIELWEMSTCIPMIKRGRERKEAERTAAMNS